MLCNTSMMVGGMAGLVVTVPPLVRCTRFFYDNVYVSLSELGGRTDC